MRAGVTPGWLVTSTTTPSTVPGAASSRPRTVSWVPARVTSNDAAVSATRYSIASGRPCHVVIDPRSNTWVSPGATSREAGASVGCGSIGVTTTGTESTVQFVWPASRTGTRQASDHGAPAPAVYRMVVPLTSVQVAASRAPAARTAAPSSPPTSSVAPRGVATIVARSASACASSPTVSGAMPGRSARDTSEAAGIRRNAYVVTVPPAVSPVTENGIRWALSSTRPRRRAPSATMPAGAPHSPRVSSAASPPDHSTLPRSTSMPSARSSRFSTVSTVSSTTG